MWYRVQAATEALDALHNAGEWTDLNLRGPMSRQQMLTAIIFVLIAVASAAVYFSPERHSLDGTFTIASEIGTAFAISEGIAKLTGRRH